MNQETDDCKKSENMYNIGTQGLLILKQIVNMCNIGNIASLQNIEKWDLTVAEDGFVVT